MPSKRNAINKRQNRKEFRKQQRKLKKKSKKLAKQFGRLQRENKLKINLQNNSNNNNNNNNNKIKSILKHTNKKNSKRKTKNKNKKRHSKSVRFADYEQIKIIKPRQPQKQAQTQTQTNEAMEDTWVDEREEKWIRQLEKRMGFSRNRNTDDNKYWKKQEFTQDGLDCFFDLETLSDESDIDEQQTENYQQYIHYKEYLDTDKNNNNTSFEEFQTAKQANKAKKASEREQRQKKQQIYGDAVYHYDEHENKNKKEPKHEIAIDNDILMKEFLEESESESDNIQQTTVEKHEKRIATAAITNKYLPPQLRKLHLNMNKNDNTAALKRCMGGHLNRLLCHNLKTISNIINEFYNDSENKYSRTEVTESLCECIYNMIYDKQPNNALNSIILCLSALIASIYDMNGMVIGSNIIEIFSNHIQLNIDKKDNNNNFMYNAIRLMSYLYLFEMLHAKYLIEILIEFVDKFENECFNVLHIVMEICGIDLRNNDPIKFKDLILLICEKSKQLTLKNNNDNNNNNVTKYSIQMEDTMKLIFDIKDNKISKYNKTNVRNSRQFKQLKSSMNAIHKMTMSYKDFINISVNGRWWLAGASVKGGGNNILAQQNKKPNPIWKSRDSAYSFDDKLMQMAKQFHMNTPIRKAIFCIVMDSDDYIDAFQKLMQLNINNGDHIEMIRIILLLCLRQTQYNKYYCLLLGKIIKHKKGWKFSLHCALWDKFTEINEMSTNDSLNMSKLLSDLINLHFLNIVVLKRLDIINTQPKNMLFVNTLFNGLLIKNHVFGMLSGNQKLKELRQDIQLFLNSLIIPRTKNEIIDLKTKHKNAQLLYKQNKMDKNELINIGLQLRKKEDFVILIRNALHSMQDYKIKASVYNDLIV